VVLPELLPDDEPPLLPPDEPPPPDPWLLLLLQPSENASATAAVRVNGQTTHWGAGLGLDMGDLPA
jgi:hypothetical protein